MEDIRVYYDDTIAHDIVETSLMSATYNQALIDVEHRVKSTLTDGLDNGRAVKIDANGEIVYATETDSYVGLLCTVEKMYREDLGLKAFYNGKEDLARIYFFQVGDRFATTAYTGLVKGDKVEIGADGKFVKQPTTPTANGVFLGEVVDVKPYGLGYDYTPAVVIKVRKTA
jgi:hypothetical protein